MRNVLIGFTIATLIAAADTAGLGATERMYVDGVSIEPRTGAVTLVLVIDLPLEDGLTKPRAKSKILSYVNWTKSKKFSDAYPKAKPDAGLHLLIAHLAPRNALGRSVLEQVDGYARELGFTTKLQLAQPSPAAK